jgi:hypothetical protein
MSYAEDPGIYGPSGHTTQVVGNRTYHTVINMHRLRKFIWEYSSLGYVFHVSYGTVYMRYESNPDMVLLANHIRGMPNPIPFYFCSPDRINWHEYDTAYDLFVVSQFLDDRDVPRYISASNMRASRNHLEARQLTVSRYLNLPSDVTVIVKQYVYGSSEHEGIVEVMLHNTSRR